ncbi:MAG: tetratricopeptide repeat protein [Myxococcales bacterium]|nr:tetratricopeptide repeat protein [Myxococcales bacterium]
MSKRLLFLEKLTSDGSADPFAWYGLALEYRNLERHDDALRTFETLKAKAPDYVPLYLMAAQMLEKLGRGAEARSYAEEGIAQAKKKGDSHALSELETLLSTLT